MILQSKQNNCGETCSRHLIKRYYRSNNIAFLKLKNECKNFLEIKLTLKEFGIYLDGYQLDKINNIESKSLLKNSICQIRCHDTLHFVIIIRKVLNLLVVHFPEKGYRIIKIKKFDQIFNNKILIIKKIEKKKVKKLYFFKFKYLASLTLLSCLETIGIIVFLEMNKIALVSMFSIAILPFIFILYMCHQVCNLSILKQFDYMFGHFYLERNPSLVNLEKINKFKNDILLSYNNKISFVMLIFLFSYYLFRISYQSGIYYLICILAGLCIEFMFKNKFKKVSIKAICFENDVFLNGKFDNKKYNKLIDFTSRQISFIYLKNILIFLIVLSFVIFISISSGYFDLYEIICQVLIVYFMVNQLTKSFNFSSLTYFYSLLDLDKSIYECQNIYK